MKKTLNFGIMALLGLVMISSACKKKPSANLYKTWSVTDVEMPNADSVTIAQYLNAGITYTFEKSGKYNYTMGGDSGNGTFTVNDEGTSMTTTEGDKVEKFNVMLTETQLQLKKGTAVMIFEAKK